MVNRFSEDSNDVFRFMDNVYANQDQLYNDETSDMTNDEIEAFIGTMAMNGTSLTNQKYVLGMKDRNMEMNTRYMFK